MDQLALTIRAQNLRHLSVVGFEDLYLQYTPLLGSIYIDFFLKVLEANILVKVPVTFECLKFMDLRGIRFERMNTVYVLHLILQSPNLQKLRVGAEAFGRAHYQAADLDFWERECPPNFTFKQLKIVDMWGMSTEIDMEFLKFVLLCSPVLEVMTISAHYNCYSGKKDMSNRVLHFRRASPKVDIRFFYYSFISIHFFDECSS